MSLKTTASQILIQTSDGTTKFTSDNKLVYSKYLKEGTVTVTNLPVKVPFVTPAYNDFVVITASFDSSTGNVNGSTAMTGKRVPANGSILTHVDGRASGNSGICDIEFIGVMPCGDSLVFTGLYFDYIGNISRPQKSTTLTYKAILYSYL